MLNTNKPIAILKKIIMNKEAETRASTRASFKGGQTTVLHGDEQEHTHDDIVAFGQLLRESYTPTNGFIPLILDSFATPQNPLSKIELANALHEIFPSWEFPSTNTSNLLRISRTLGHNIAITKAGRNSSYYLDSMSENTEIAPTYKSRATKTETLRQLIEEGTHSNSQIIDTLFPNMRTERQSKNFSVHLTELRNRLKEEGAYIPDRRLSPEANLRILHNPPTLLKEGAETALASDIPSNPTSDRGQERTERTTIPSDPRNVKQIPDVIEKRSVLRNENNIPRLIRYKDPDTQLLYVQIETPDGKHTKPLHLTSDEINLFRTIFENSDIYSRVRLEIAMVDISRSTTYEGSGGFELTFNTLNQKLLKEWNICMTFNEEGRAVLGNPDQHQNLTIDTKRSIINQNSERQPGQVRKRMAPRG